LLSTKFPTDKAIAYVKLVKPYVINDLEMQSVLNDRRSVYKMLQSVDIAVPYHVILNRDDSSFREDNLEEYDDVQALLLITYS
jgi:inositol hexakisphosphate/diphosphoinositol-pentakisphosphate kinase